jgi:GntR family transcriptional regulator
MAQIKNMALCGALTAGDQLPSVRELAVALKINPNTVAKVYRELQHDGVIESKWGEGNFVSGKFIGTAAVEKKKIIKASLRGLIHQAESFGLSKAEIKEILSEYPEKGK